jgi:hypothetical protein
VNRFWIWRRLEILRTTLWTWLLVLIDVNGGHAVFSNSLRTMSADL